MAPQYCSKDSEEPDPPCISWSMEEYLPMASSLLLQQKPRGFESQDSSTQLDLQPETLQQECTAAEELYIHAVFSGP